MFSARMVALHVAGFMFELSPLNELEEDTLSLKLPYQVEL